MVKFPQISVLKRVLGAACFGLVPIFSLENTNIPGYDAVYQFFDYNRLRGELSISSEKYTDFSATIIVDNETFYITELGSLVNTTSIHRAYLEYSGVRHLWVVGKQRIPLGVGHFWNPIDVFNPINIEAMEPGERPGTDTIRYEYALGELSNIDLNIARGKGAARIKGFLEYADLALLAVWDEDTDLDILGWEVEGELGGTGIELRSEGGSFHNQILRQRHTEFILGAEYGFANSLVLTGEYHYMDVPRRDEFGLSASFQPEMLWTCSVLTVTEFEDGSGFISPVLEYSLSDEMTLSGGVFLYHGSDNTYYGSGADRLYVRWFVHF